MTILNTFYKFIFPFLFAISIFTSCGGSDKNATISDKSGNAKLSDCTDLSELISEYNDLYKIDSVAYYLWGNPNSPYRDEDRYIDFLNDLLALENLPEDISIRATERLRIASLNRPGWLAADFIFTDRNGNKQSLHSFKANKLLLIFYDPECAHCTDILNALADEPALNAAIANGSISVLAIYAEGKRDVWNKTMHDMPANWNVGYDLTGILDKDLYNFQAMPTPYLLDSDHRVLLKDPPFPLILDTL